MADDMTEQQAEEIVQLSCEITLDIINGMIERGLLVQLAYVPEPVFELTERGRIAKALGAPTIVEQIVLDRLSEMGGRMKISEHASLSALAANVVLRAVEQLRDPDPREQVDAMLFLVSRQFGLFSQAAGIPYVDPRRIIRTRGGEAGHKYRILKEKMK